MTSPSTHSKVPCPGPPVYSRIATLNKYLKRDCQDFYGGLLSWPIFISYSTCRAVGSCMKRGVQNCTLQLQMAHMSLHSSSTPYVCVSHQDITIEDRGESAFDLRLRCCRVYRRRKVAFVRQGVKALPLHLKTQVKLRDSPQVRCVKGRAVIALTAAQQFGRQTTRNIASELKLPLPRLCERERHAA